MTTAASAYDVKPAVYDGSLFICPACENSSSRCTGVRLNQRSRGERVLRRCLDCRSFFDPEKYDLNEEVVHTQSTAWGRPDSGKDLNHFKTRMFQNILRLLREHCAPPAILLDVGCSYGGFLIQARKSGYQVAGFDIVPEAIEYVQSLNISAERSFSIGESTLARDGTLDIVTCLDCNCYWKDQTTQLRYAFAKLKPGGYLAMRVVDKSWMFSFGLAFHRIAPRLSHSILCASINDHRFSMPVKSLLKVIRSSGFGVSFASPCGAMHSDNTSVPVKFSFAFGSLLWKMTGVFMAPGAVILARKPLI